MKQDGRGRASAAAERAPSGLPAWHRQSPLGGSEQGVCDLGSLHRCFRAEVEGSARPRDRTVAVAARCSIANLDLAPTFEEPGDSLASVVEARFGSTAMSICAPLRNACAAGRTRTSIVRPPSIDRSYPLRYRRCDDSAACVIRRPASLRVSTAQSTRSAAPGSTTGARTMLAGSSTAAESSSRSACSRCSRRRRGPASSASPRPMPGRSSSTGRHRLARRAQRAGDPNQRGHHGFEWSGADRLEGPGVRDLISDSASTICATTTQAGRNIAVRAAIRRERSATRPSHSSRALAGRSTRSVNSINGHIVLLAISVLAPHRSVPSAHEGLGRPPARRPPTRSLDGLLGFDRRRPHRETRSIGLISASELLRPLCSSRKRTCRPARSRSSAAGSNASAAALASRSAARSGPRSDAAARAVSTASRSSASGFRTVVILRQRREDKQRVAIRRVQSMVV